jgi:hypothetical protein
VSEREQTHWSPGLIGFYVSCASVSLGAAVASVSFLTFGDREGTGKFGAVGIGMIVLGAAGALFSLRKARKEM